MDRQIGWCKILLALVVVSVLMPLTTFATEEGLNFVVMLGEGAEQSQSQSNGLLFRTAVVDPEGKILISEPFSLRQKSAQIQIRDIVPGRYLVTLTLIDGPPHPTSLNIHAYCLVGVPGRGELFPLAFQRRHIRTIGEQLLVEYVYAPELIPQRR